MVEEVSVDLTEDAFAMAFEAAAGLSDGAPPVVEDPLAEPVVEEPVVEELVVEAAPSPVVEAPPPPPVQRPPDPVAVIPEPAVVQSLSEDLTEEEQATLNSVVSDFPEVAKVLDVYKRTLAAKFENVLNAKVAELTQQFDRRITPAINVAADVARSRHEAEILKGHADAYTVLPAVETWVSTQPSFVQKSYNAVLDSGSAAEVVALLNIFKKETGSAQVPPPPSAEDVAQKAAKERKLKSQEGVRGRQAAQKGGIDENDFESAFKAAANM